MRSNDFDEIQFVKDVFEKTPFKRLHVLVKCNQACIEKLVFNYINLTFVQYLQHDFYGCKEKNRVQSNISSILYVR